MSALDLEHDDSAYWDDVDFLDSLDERGAAFGRMAQDLPAAAVLIAAQAVATVKTPTRRKTI